MRYPRTLVSLRTFGLAFAIALSPALMQTDDLGCHTIGNTDLAMLEVEVNGENVIVFDPTQHVYEVLLAEPTESVIVRAESVDPGADVMWNLSGLCPPPIADGHFEIGGGEAPIEEVPVGHSILKVSVHAPEGAADFYAVYLTQMMQCE